jgi:hypothetical protein
METASSPSRATIRSTASAISTWRGPSWRQLCPGAPSSDEESTNLPSCQSHCQSDTFVSSVRWGRSQPSDRGVRWPHDPIPAAPIPSAALGDRLCVVRRDTRATSSSSSSTSRWTTRLPLGSWRTWRAAVMERWAPLRHSRLPHRGGDGGVADPCAFVVGTWLSLAGALDDTPVRRTDRRTQCPAGLTKPPTRRCGMGARRPRLLPPAARHVATGRPR